MILQPGLHLRERASFAHALMAKPGTGVGRITAADGVMLILLDLFTLPTQKNRRRAGRRSLRVEGMCGTGYWCYEYERIGTYKYPTHMNDRFGCVRSSLLLIVDKQKTEYLFLTIRDEKTEASS